MNRHEFIGGAVACAAAGLWIGGAVAANGAGSVGADAPLRLERGAPVAYENPLVTPDAPDPTVWNGGDGWCYSASTGQRVMRSRDLAHWEPTGHRMLSSDGYAAAKAGGYHVWAPDVVKIGPRWHLYATFWKSKEDSKIVVFTSERPEGPFSGGRTITHSKLNGIVDTIDAEVVRDPESGRLWLFFGAVGRIHRVELAPDGLSLATGAQYVHVAGRSKYEPNAAPRRKYVFEGSYLYRRGGWWYLFASSGEYQNETYSVVVGRARSLTGEFADRKGRPMREGFAETILRSEKGDAFYGPGHNGEIFETPSGRTYIFYHCHWTGVKPGCRPMFLQEIFWDKDGWPYFGNGGRPQKNGTVQ